MRQLSSRLSTAHVIAGLALFFALGGGVVYANHENIRSSDIVDGQVSAQDLRGPVTVYGDWKTIKPTGRQKAAASTARCPGTGKVLSGGWQGHGEKPPIEASAAQNRPFSFNTWSIVLVNDAQASAIFRTVARCIPAAQSASSQSAEAAEADAVEETGQALESVRDSLGR